MVTIDCLLVGFAATFGTITIHGFLVHTVIMALRRNLHSGRIGSDIRRNLAFITITTLATLLAILLEVTLWALVLQLCGEFPNFETAFYSSAGSFTTVGTGTVALPDAWRLLAPIESAAGMLMFGISTAVIFAILQRLIEARFSEEL